MKKNLFSLLQPLIIAGLLIGILTGWSAPWLLSKNIQPMVIQVANLVLLLTSCLNIYFQRENLRKANPQAVMRGIIGATMIKLFFLAALVLIYLVAAGKNRSVFAVLVSMGCYIIYSAIETRISLRMKSEK